MKQPKCSECGEPFTRFRPLQSVCGPKCAIDKAKKDSLKPYLPQRKKKATKPRDRGEALERAQKAVNGYIRARDKDKPCISCGRNTGAKMNAGHYKSVGGNPELRFCPLNIHLQCEHCNSWKSSNHSEYKKALIELLGQETVDYLEGPHQARHYSMDELEEIGREFSVWTRELIGG